MKWVIVIFLFSVPAKAQVFFDSSKVFYSETDALIIPIIHFAYGLKQYDFIEKNTGLTVDRKYIHTNIYFGATLLSDGYAVGLHFDPFNFSLMMGAGINIPIHIGKKRTIHKN